MTADVEDQMGKVIARTDFAVRVGQTSWLQPEPDKLCWLRGGDDLALSGKGSPA